MLQIGQTASTFERGGCGRGTKEELGSLEILSSGKTL